MWFDWLVCGVSRNKEMKSIALVTHRAEFGQWDLSKLSESNHAHVKDRDSAVFSSAHHVKLMINELDPGYDSESASIRWSYLAMHNNINPKSESGVEQVILVKSTPLAIASRHSALPTISIGR